MGSSFVVLTSNAALTFSAAAPSNASLASTSGIASNRAARLMMRLGFEPMGSFMQKEI